MRRAAGLHHLLEFPTLRMRNFARRHGLGSPNRQGIIVSHPDNGPDDYGLSDHGVAQVEKSLAGVRKLGPATLVPSSDFRPLRESAEIARCMPGFEHPVAPAAWPRKRYFGDCEPGSDSACRSVRLQDARDAGSRSGNVASANQVMARVTAVVGVLENRLRDGTVLPVSHGDALQIPQTAFARRGASSHRQHERLETAETGRMRLAPRPR